MIRSTSASLPPAWSSTESYRRNFGVEEITQESMIRVRIVFPGQEIEVTFVRVLRTKVQSVVPGAVLAFDNSASTIETLASH